ncbi:hypothetical protein LCGC14_1755730 [marine sediment metagenome]|uniref:Uncharacterized protein n=1 Tax=marine sediment metagenome TaxID=412755 RepID=A0A0F9HPY4_9ZZZZ
MPKYKVTMICREISRAEIIVDNDNNDYEQIKDIAWASFDVIREGNLEQENYTKVEEIKE